MNKSLPVVALLAVILLLDVASVRHKTLTSDEEEHYRYGMSILRGHSDRELNQATMPISALNAIPGFLGAGLPPGRVREWLGRIETGRYITIGASLLLALLVFHWANRLYGYRSALFSLFLYAFSPNIIAHSRLVTTDIYAAGMMTLTLYCAWRFSEQGGWKWAATTAVALGASQLIKCTCLILYPIIGVLALIRAVRTLCRTPRPGRLEVWRKTFTAGLIGFLLLIAVSLVIINIGFLLNGSGTPLGSYSFMSETFKGFQEMPGGIRTLSLPLPRPFLTGLDALTWEGETGERANNYLFGETRPGNRGFAGYFFWTFLFKVPLAIQMIILLAVIFYIVNRKRYCFWSNELFLVIPTAVFWIYINYFSVYNAGIRYSIMVFPLIFIFCGSLIGPRSRLPRAVKIFIPAILLYLVVSVLSYFPHFISYFNELIPDRKMAYRVLADTNINWGQNKWYLEKYLRENPGAIWNPGKPVAGKIVVTVNKLVGEFNPEEYRWLRENFQPRGQIAYSYLIYDISPSDLEKIR